MFNLEENKNSDEEPLISRYHPSMPLTVKNPCNNEIIVGEVEFFLLSNNRNNQGPIEDQYKATFIGTDFNYAHSNDFRKLILDNSIDIEDIKNQIRSENGSLLNANIITE